MVISNITVIVYTTTIQIFSKYIILPSEMSCFDINVFNVSLAVLSSVSSKIGIIFSANASQVKINE